MLSFTPSSVPELHRFMQSDVAAQRQAVAPQGGGTALRCGHPLRREATELHLERLRQVIDYPARDMTITVEAGLRVRDLQQLLAEERQRLAIDIPQAAEATIGGAIATNVSGSRRFGHGTFRDYLIGVTAIDGQGRLFSAGGRVVKNVAGYDLCKLLIGSLGTLGVITQVTLKLRPMPELTQGVWVSFDNSDRVELALQRLVTTSTRPVAVDLYNPRGAERIAALSDREFPVGQHGVCLIYEGSEAEVRWQIEKILEELRPVQPLSEVVWNPVDSLAVISAMTEFTATPEDTFIAHLSVPPSQVTGFVSQLTLQGLVIQSHAANGIIHALLPERHSTRDALPAYWDKLCELVAAAQGHASLTGGPEQIRENTAVLGNRRDDWTIMSGIRKALDPHELLNPGRIRLRP
jgi:glycolate oxidase FAD binding subunit